MKFEYVERGTDEAMVAFIDDAGDLCIKVGDGLVYLVNEEFSSFVEHQADFDNYADANGVSMSFRKGDKITITF